MPFLRTQRGTKISFSQARLSALLSLVYLEVMGDRTPKYRSNIQKHCEKIWKSLELTFGSGEKDEWPGSGIQREIDEELRINASIEVHEAFLSMKINEFQDTVKSPIKNISSQKFGKSDINSNFGGENEKHQGGWNRFESKTEKQQLPLTHLEHIDPIWAVLIKKSEEFQNIKESIQEKKQEFFLPISLSERLGVNAKIEQLKVKIVDRNNSIQIRRSEWIVFWKNLPKKEIPWHVWEQQRRNHRRRAKIRPLRRSCSKGVWDAHNGATFTHP